MRPFIISAILNEMNSSGEATSEKIKKSPRAISRAIFRVFAPQRISLGEQLTISVVFSYT
jgi:hypothetical protein